MSCPDVSELILMSLREDLGSVGDITTESTVSEDATGDAVIVAKQQIVVCGLGVAEQVYGEVGKLYGEVEFTPLVADGDSVEVGTRIATLNGSLRTVMIGERIALNFMMMMSGVATNTAKFVAAAEGSSLGVVDTRKTTPGHRALEKYAVTCGGARNHRFGLFDAVLIKDNHLVAAGGVLAAVNGARKMAHHLTRVEVEVVSLRQLREAIEVGADVALLDNMDDATLAAAVDVRDELGSNILLEASGNMSIERILAIKDIGLDYVSVGALIHQAQWVDLSLRVESRAV